MIIIAELVLNYHDELGRILGGARSCSGTRISIGNKCQENYFIIFRFIENSKFGVKFPLSHSGLR